MYCRQTEIRSTTSIPQAKEQAETPAHDSRSAIRSESHGLGETERPERKWLELDEMACRLDPAESNAEYEIPSIDKTTEFDPGVTVSSWPPPFNLERSESVRLSGFFVILFLLGQGMATWALLSSHFTAWLMGIGFSAAGVSIAFFNLMSQIEKQNQKIERLNQKLATRRPARRLNTHSFSSAPHFSRSTRAHHPPLSPRDY